MARYALLVGISKYPSDPTLDPLPRAVLDVEALRQVLIDPEIGGFGESDVTVLMDAEKVEIETAVSELFTKPRPEDLVLFYFSGHGVIDPRNDKFYLTSCSTRTNLLSPTAIWSKYVHEEMNDSRSQHQVIILDCCNSGAFPEGIKGDGILTVNNILPKLGGEGKVVLTASDSNQYAFEEKGFELSLYTHFLVEGLKTGAADKDEDGHISVNELHEYVEAKVVSVNDRMSPKFYGFMKEGQPIFLAKAVQDNPLKFRKEVETIAHESNGVISIFARHDLELVWQDLGIDQIEAETIISEVLCPYQEYAKKLEQYTQALQKEADNRFPFSRVVETQLQSYENRLGLRAEDLQAVKDQIIAPKQAEYEQQLQIMQRQEEIERLKRQHITKSAMSAAEVLKHQQPILISEIFGKQPQNIPSTSSEFEFEFVKIKVVKERGFLGIGGGVRTELERKQGKADYIREDLGNGISLDLVRIPAGKFMMGSNESGRESPIHEVKVSEFWMGKYTLTNAQWFAVMGTKPSEKYDVKFQGEKQPVVGVSWNDCMEFCKKLSEKIKKNIRLPSEAEWEYSCRAGTTTPFHFGATITPDIVNYDGNYPYGDAPKGKYRQKTIDVGSFPPNAFGLYDMHGNVREWCLDEWHDNYNSKPQSFKDNGNEPWRETKIEDNDNRYLLLRGGSWFVNAFGCRSASRNHFRARVQNDIISFRLVCALR